ncbi:unnamed protein product [Rotaria magnacalcarata]|uniref:Uncharacterized protein n=1 Tax=Rotaria magnacalcarata TaxID=392030 RepID=A0A814U0U7_9BILA|nr:unnamed protein product [Rotaria magnacalcarata]CAF1441922.1 unnamed protein product [Rotaria magnacalcarata]CAF2219521.1 unnamed protein product [Rotaria magnacalcarata]CAF4617693.1 unnamed protein product [Rotaria magnacalcarata]CAF5056787.1 unnamed protein product [Rotaria magnacalcarata]
MTELKRLFASLENAELARAQIDDEHASILNQLHALSEHSHMVKHKYLTTMKDTFSANLSRYRDEDLRVRSSNLIKEKSIQVKWPIINNNEKQTENLVTLQQIKNSDNENEIPPPLIINSNQAYLIDNFDLIKQRYSSLADFNLSPDGKQLRITFKPENMFVVLEAITNGRYGQSWKIIDSMPSLPSFTQLNTIIRQSNNITAEQLCLIRACLLKQQKINE